MTLNEFFNSKKDYGAIFLRLIIGFALVQGVWSIVFHWKNMAMVQGYFQSFGIPLPAISAPVAVYAEFICGILFILGLFTRYAAVLMIITFIVAIAYVDIHKKFDQAFPALVILAASTFFLFHGAGKISADEQLKKILD